MKILFLLAGFALTIPVLAQTRISGRITDKSGNGVPLANVLIQGTYDGTSSSETGVFEFTTMEQGNHVVVVRSVGYKEFQREITLEGKPVTLDVVLQEALLELRGVTITAGSFTAGDESRRTVFKALDIATTAGATADIAGALNTLPGTQKAGESGRLFVRGGDGDETRTFIDGLVVLDAYRPSAPNTPSRGRFMPFMFKGVSFATGGYSAEYGQALSSALVLDSKDESGITRTDIGILSVGGDVAHTQAWRRGSASGKLQYTNIHPYVGLIKQKIDWKSAPTSIEGIAAIRQKVGTSGMLKVYGNTSNSRFSLYNPDIDNHQLKHQYAMDNNYRYLNGSYKDVLGGDWIIRGGVSWTSQRNDITYDQYWIDERESGVHTKAVVEGVVSDRIELKTGAEAIHRQYDEDRGIENSLSTTRGFTETVSAAFAEADVHIHRNFMARLGGRLEYNDLAGRLYADPRISMAYKTGASSQVSLAYGTFRQSPANRYLLERKRLAPTQAEHFIVNYQWLENNRTFRIESYYKRYSALVKFENGDPAQPTNRGKGYAYGAELFWRDNQWIKNFDYWVSYSFLNTERDYLHYPHSAMPTFASRHNFSVVAKYFIAKLKTQAGSTYSFASRRPYHNPNEEGFNSGRTPHYHDLSINISYLPKPHVIVYFSCTNLTGRDNIFGYEYGTVLNEDGMYNRRAIRQPAPRFVFLGIFITFSKDKSVNQLPVL